MGEVIAPKIVSEIKSGIKTTEFYFSAILSIASMIVALGPSTSPVVQTASLIVAVAAQLGYVVSRTVIKS